MKSGNTNKFRSVLFWLFWDFSGARFLYEKIFPPNKDNKYKNEPSSFLFWVIGVYVAFWGLSSQRYENRIDTIENRASSVNNQLSTNAWRRALESIPQLQKMTSPREPDILNPFSVFSSLFGSKEKYEPVCDLLKETVSNWRDSLEDLSLSEIDMQSTDLSYCNLRNAKISDSRFDRCTFFKGDLRNASLYGSSFENTDFSFADLRGTYFAARKQGSEEHDLPNFKNANFTLADLRQAHIYSIDVFADCKSLYGAKFDSAIEGSLREKYSSLFDVIIDSFHLGWDRGYYLHQNKPNPFDSTTSIGINHYEKHFVKLTIYDALGNALRTILNDTLNEGSNTIHLSGREFATGIYFYRIECKDFVETKRMMRFKSSITSR